MNPNRLMRDLGTMIPQALGSVVTVIVLIAALLGATEGSSQTINPGANQVRPAAPVNPGGGYRPAPAPRPATPRPAQQRATAYYLTGQVKNARNVRGTTAVVGGRQYRNSIIATQVAARFEVTNPQSVRRLSMKAAFPDSPSRIARQGTVTVHANGQSKTYPVRTGRITNIDLTVSNVRDLSVNVGGGIALLTPVVYR